MARRDPSPLSVLSAAALALPAFGASQPTERTLAVSTAVYQEDDLKRSNLVFGDVERYKVKTNQFYINAPIGRNWSGSLSYDNESMSGASPWGTSESADGQSDVIMSGASIDDSRNGLDASMTRYFDQSSVSVSLGYSGEHDYHSRSIGLSYERDFFNRNTTLGLSASYSTDEITPTDAALFGRVLYGEKRSRSFYASLTQLMSPVAVLNVGVGLTSRRGFLSDPYKLRDIRPDSRLEKTITASYRHYLDWKQTSLRFDYRYFWDSFDVRSQTVSGSFMQSLSSGISWGPTLRYYAQSEASFYQSFDQYALPVTQAQSSDFRLSSYGAWSYGVKARYQLGAAEFSGAIERYESDKGLGLNEPVAGHPALVRFGVVSLGLEFKF